ncbi:hypothetical protein SXCC_00812 [Gluconacetobacter sp. SXCC-1]|nr:hypothetical protein SXCC_00812 [Gluconacetobacter sp. SXCC-1]
MRALRITYGCWVDLLNQRSGVAKARPIFLDLGLRSLSISG